MKGVCPDTVVVQQPWWPGADQGFLYQLLGPNPTVDKDTSRVTGPLGGTGVTLELRAGGPAVGFQPASSILAQDDDILLGDISTDESIQNSAEAPTVAVFSVYEKNPQVLLWGDQSWNYSTVADIGRAGTTVLVSPSQVSYPDVFEREGLLKKDQIDTSYQGSPDRFVAADGKVIQQGFVTYEPYQLEHEVKAWNKPVKYLLLDKDYPVYRSQLAIRPDKIEESRSCLAGLVPLLQQAQRDYVTDPSATNQLLLKVIDSMNTSGFTLSPEVLANANAKQNSLGLISDGSDGVLGSFDTARVQTLIDRLVPTFEAKGDKLKPGLAPPDLVTNEFLDRSISLK